jgi:hypothetical protein
MIGQASTLALSLALRVLLVTALLFIVLFISGASIFAISAPRPLTSTGVIFPLAVFPGNKSLCLTFESTSKYGSYPKSIAAVNTMTIKNLDDPVF